MKSLMIVVLFFLIGVPNTFGRPISASIPKEVKPGEKYVFYLHGAIIQSQGIDAVSPYWGRYEYIAILDTIRQPYMAIKLSSIVIQA